MSFWWTNPFIMVKYYLPSLAIFLVLKSLCNINAVIPVSYAYYFHSIFFHFIISTNQYLLFEWHLCSRYYIVVCSTYLLLCSKLLQILDAYIITILFLRIVCAGLGCAVLLFCVGFFTWLHPFEPSWKIQEVSLTWNLSLSKRLV